MIAAERRLYRCFAAKVLSVLPLCCNAVILHAFFIKDLSAISGITNPAKNSYRRAFNHNLKDSIAWISLMKSSS